MSQPSYDYTDRLLMPENTPMAPGEIGRALERIERNMETDRKDAREHFQTLARDLQALSGMPYRLTQLEGDVSESVQRFKALDVQYDALEERLVAMRLQAAYLSGGIAVLGVVINLFWHR